LKEPTGRALVSLSPQQQGLKGTRLPMPVGQRQDHPAEAEQNPKNTGPDVRHMTPRDVVELGLDLYATGVIQWEEYALMAFHSELHPDYPQTIGALTGQAANPDGPRDFVRYWEERLDYEQRYNADDPEAVDRVRRVLAILRGIAAPTNLVA
jgi:hypothetical protein